MTSRLIEHIGILVTDLEAAIERWEAVTGYTFSPIARYRTARYTDSSDAAPHDHDARISFSLEGPPRIELMEVTGSGTHGAAELGVHHLAFQGVGDSAGEIEQLAALGVGVDGASLGEDDEPILWFTDKGDLDQVRLEFITTVPGPIVADDGSALPRDPDTGRAIIW